MTGTVEIRNVVKRFGKVEAVRDVSFSLLEGETVALVGHNGAGKTTLMKLMLGLIRPTSGHITVLGDDPAAGEFAAPPAARLPAGERLVQRRPDGPRDAGVLRPPQARAAKAAVGPLLERVGLTHAANRRVGTYSKGMRQRLGLAQALLGEPQRPPARRADHRPRPGPAPQLLRDRRGAARARRDGAAVLARPDRAGGARRTGHHHEPRHQGRGRHARRAAPHRAAADPHPPEGHRCRADQRRRTGSVRSTGGARSTATWSRSTPRPSARSRCCGAPPTKVRRSRISTWCRRPSTSSTPISFVAGGRAMRNILIVARKEIQEGLRNRWVLATTLLLAALALTLTFLGSAPTGNVGRARPRRGDRQPVQPHDLPAAADRAADLARRHRRRDGARHHAAAPELPGGALAGAARQVRRPPAILAFATLLGYGAAAGALAGDRGGDRRGELDGVRLDGRLLDPARRRVHRRRLPRQRAGARARHGGAASPSASGSCSC